MNYRDAIGFIMARLPMFQRVGAAAYKADLNNTLEIMELLGHPEAKFRSVHIAGTNGKGSCSHMLASVFQSAGLRTGLYTSPHLKDFRERIRINGKMIPRRKVSAFTERLGPEMERINPSFFEMSVGLAFDYFASEKVDIAVIETGLGGRLDSTNVITPLLSVITNIGLDHTALLGKTIREIALEKAGIIKSGIPVVIGESQPETAEVFIRNANLKHAPLSFADCQLHTANIRFNGKGGDTQIMDVYAGDRLAYHDLRCPLSGHYQQKNILAVLCALEILDNTALRIPPEAIYAGIRNVVRQTGLKGRWQVLSHKPLTICDTGHNTDGIRAVMAQITVTPHKKLHFVFGMVNDKDTNSILQLLPSDAAYYFCRANIPRGLDAEELHAKAGLFGLSGQAYFSVAEAYAAALSFAAPEDLIFIGGSTFVVAEVL